MIGINSQIATGGSTGSVGIGFAVPIGTAKGVVRQLIAHGRVQRPWMGVEFIPVDETTRQAGVDAKSGLLVQNVVSGGPAAHAGMAGGDRAVPLSTGEELLVGGDVVTSIADVPTSSTDDVRRALTKHEPGDTVPVEVERDGRPQTFEVTLANRPAGRADG